MRLRDLDTGNILFESKNKGAFVASSKRFYVRFRLEVFDGETLVLEHELRLQGPGGADPVPGRHPGRHPGLVPLRRPVPARSTAAS